MRSYDDYKQHRSGLEKKKATLLNNKTTIERQITILEGHREAAIVLEDKEAVNRIVTTLSSLNKQLVTIENELDNLSPIALAEAVYIDCQAELLNLAEQSSKQWENCICARENFLAELKQLGRIRSESSKVRDMSGEVAPLLRRNPVDLISFHGINVFEVSLRTITGLLK